MSRSLSIVHRAPHTRAVVLVLHGGQARSDEPTTWRQLSVWRSRLLASAIARAGRPSGVSVAFLRYTVRGWNDGAPVHDAQWALAELRRMWPGAPLGLLGYSMGGRVALRLASQVDALATVSAWVEHDDLSLLDPAPGLPTLLVHGSEDQVTSPQGSLTAAARLRELGADANARLDEPDSHAMMRYARTWHRLVGDHLVEHLVPEQGAVRPSPRDF